MKPLLGLAATLLLVAGAAPAADKRPMQVEDLFKFRRVAAPQISPDGKQVVYQVTTVSLEENKSTTALWLAATDGKTPPKALTDPKGKKDLSPRWSPDGKTILFESTRPGIPQLFTVPAAGGEPKQITNISTGAGSPIWSPDGTRVAFVSAVWPEFSEKPFEESDKLNKEKEEAIEKNPVKAKVFTKLFYRHWVEYVDDKRQHLFVQRVSYLPHESPESPDALKYPRDVTPGDRDAYPTSTTFSSGDDFTFTPDSKHLVFTAVPEKNEAWSTNYDLCRVSIGNSSTKWETLTKGNPAADSGPKFSPDGTKLAWRMQKKAGYEADKWDVVVANCKPDGSLATAIINLLEHKDVSCNEFAWRGEHLAFTADQHARSLTHYVPMKPNSDIVPEDLVFGSASSLSYSADGKHSTFAHTSLNAPTAVWATYSDGGGSTSIARVSHANDSLLAELDLAKPESVKVKIEDGTMQMWILKPPGFDEKKKWAVVYLIHGGPQGAWEDAWSNRWNAQAWAAQGYVVVMPNPREHRIRPEVRGRNHRRLGREVLPRPRGRARLRREAAIRGQGPHRLCRRLLRRLHAKLVRRVGHRPALQVPDLALLCLELREHVGHDGRTLVRRMGTRRAAVGEAEEIRRVLPAQEGRQHGEAQGADADHPQRSRFPLPDRAGARIVQRPAASGRAEPLRELPGRGALGAEAEEQPALAPRGI